MSESQALVPVGERSVDFYGDEVVGVIIELDGERRIYVPVRPLCRYLGLDWSAQRQRIMRDEVLAEEVRFVVTTTTNPLGGDPETLALPLDLLPGWLFGINAGRVRQELRPVLNRYRQECFRVLAQAFPSEAVLPRLSTGETADHASFPGFVYIAQAGPHTKIGAAKDAQKRVRALNASFPFPVTLQHSIATDDMFELERLLHVMYRRAGKHVKGEWFELSDDDHQALRRVKTPVARETMPVVLHKLACAALLAPSEVSL